MDLPPLSPSQLLPLAREPRLFGGPAVVAADRVGDLGEVADARRRHDGVLTGRVARRERGQRSRCEPQPALRQPRRQRLVQRGHAVVVEARRDRAEHRHLVGRVAEQLAIALVLLAHVAQRILRALAVELVDGDEVGEVEHVDLFELRRGAELGRHHVQRHVDVRHDRRVALADAGRLDDDQVEARDLARRDARRAAPCVISLPASRVASERM